MELVFEMLGAQQFAPGVSARKSFKQAGGLIGRAENCDWVIPDRKRVVSAGTPKSAIGMAPFISPTPAATAYA